MYRIKRREMGGGNRSFGEDKISKKQWLHLYRSSPTNTVLLPHLFPSLSLSCFVFPRFIFSYFYEE